VTRQSPEQTARSFGVDLYRQAYNQGITVSQLLERMDPTSERPAEERGLDAFERVLKEAGIITTPMPEFGVRASTWEEATDTAERRAMMHEFAARIWRQATGREPVSASAAGPIREARAVLLSGDVGLGTIANAWEDATDIRAKRLVPPIRLGELVARETSIDGDAYRALYITDDFGNDAYRMKRVAEGAEIPTTTLVSGEHTTRLHKFGRGLRSTYEQLRRQRLDRIAFIIARMALQAEVDKVGVALDTIINGDGNANTAATVLTQTGLDSGSSAGTLTLEAWLAFKLRFTNAYRANAVLAQEASFLQLALLPIATGNNAPLLLQTNALGGLDPMDDLLSNRLRYGITADAPALKLVAFDTTQAIERVSEVGGQVSEVERFIGNQTQLFTFTETEGYATVDANASKVLNINA
jgi:hypothetical protein